MVINQGTGNKYSYYKSWPYNNVIAICFTKAINCWVTIIITLYTGVLKRGIWKLTPSIYTVLQRNASDTLANPEVNVAINLKLIHNNYCYVLVCLCLHDPGENSMTKGHPKFLTDCSRH